MFRPHWVAPCRGVCAFPVYTAQAPGCSIWSRPCIECRSSFRVLHNSADSVAPACCVFPASAVQAAKGLRTFSLARCDFSLRGEWLRQQEVLVASPRMRGLFPPWPQRALVGSHEVFRQEPGPACRVGGGGFSGAEFAPFPSPLPPTSPGDGPALLWSFLVPLFCEPPAVCSGRLTFPCYPTV